MFRLEAVLALGGYRRIRPGDDAAQDYHLWLRLSDRHSLANLPDVLVDYRIHDSQVSMRRRAAQRKCAELARQMATKRRTDRGEPGRVPSRLGPMDRLRGKPGSAGSDYLALCDLHRNGALRLARCAVLSSPLSGRAWREFTRRLLGRRGVEALRPWLGRRGETGVDSEPGRLP
jgi:hypothetical protein